MLEIMCFLKKNIKKKNSLLNLSICNWIKAKTCKIEELNVTLNKYIYIYFWRHLTNGSPSQFQEFSLLKLKKKKEAEKKIINWYIPGLHQSDISVSVGVTG